jgi:serine-type D-Ala-D-Ala carboxypeptidase (penicillin-binding protein 5/6)
MARASLFMVTSLALSVAVVAPSASATTTVLGGSTLAAHGTLVHAAAHVPALPPTSATSFIVADATTGQILAARDVHGRLAPASTLKTLTAVTAFPWLSGSTKVVGSRTAAATEGTQVGINAGQTYTAKQLFTAMLVMSANDAAVSIGDAIGGGRKALSRMNAEAAHLQARDTVARTTNGLDAPGQTSSAYDLALIFRAGIANPRFLYYISVRSAPFPLAHGKSYTIYTHDRLLNSYPGMIGGKNGYTVAAHASFVGAAKRGGHTIIVAVMRDVPDFWPEVTSLLDWGFAADGHVQPVGYLVAPRK